ncbi:hypothetical protein LTR94_027394, partial [Friedmanniomyces endolithicus]
GEPVARAALDALIRNNRRDDGLWVRATDDAGVVIDAAPDLYDLAFVLFGLAAAHRVLKDERALPLALATLAAMEAGMADALHGGWHEALPPSLPRRQNPHMHLLEALLFWQAAAPHPAWDSAARRILDLFATRFFDARFGVLGEYFAADWSIAPGALGEVAEPGHHMEWVWLLGEAARLGLPDLSSPARALYTSALTCGVRADGLAVREINRIGQVRDGGVRLWAQTELLRVLHARGEHLRAAGLIDRLFETHLATTTPGLWIDAFDAEGRPLDAARPAAFLDRDGVLNVEINGVHRAQDLELMPDAGNAVRRANAAGIPVICVTNQPDIAKGFLSEETLGEVMAALDTGLAAAGAYLDDIF